MHTVTLKSAKFFAYHGVYSQEQVLGNWYEVDVEVIGSFTDASSTDNIDKTVNYQVLYESVKQQMNRSQKLLETVLDNIYASIIDEYPFINRIEIKLRKLNPPVGGQVAFSEVTLSKNTK